MLWKILDISWNHEPVALWLFNIAIYGTSKNGPCSIAMLKNQRVTRSCDNIIFFAAVKPETSEDDERCDSWQVLVVFVLLSILWKWTPAPRKCMGWGNQTNIKWNCLVIFCSNSTWNRNPGHAIFPSTSGCLSVLRWCARPQQAGPGEWGVQD